MDAGEKVIPYGYCHCGCGGLTKIVTKTKTSRGEIKGVPLTFIHGHHGRKEFCIRGHLNIPENRTSGGACKKCYIAEKSSKPCDCGCGKMTNLRHGTPSDFLRGHKIKKEFCIRGHDLSLRGQNKHGKCRQCARSDRIKWKKENPEKVAHQAKKRYDLNPKKFKDRAKELYHLNPKLYIARSVKWQKEHKELVKVWRVKAQKKWMINNLDRFRRAQKVYNHEKMSNLTDSYVTNTLHLHKSDVPPELIELKRQHLQLKRFAKAAQKLLEV